MSEDHVAGSAVAVLANAHTLVDELFNLSLTTGTDDELLDCHRSLERLRNRLAGLEYALIGEEQTRGLPEQYGAASTATFLRGLLRLDVSDANARARGAAAAGPRRMLTGETVPPVFPLVAAAQAAGDISPKHAAVIVATIDRLPDAVQAEHGEQVEAGFVEHSRVFDPNQVAMLGRRLLDVLDPDGILHDAEYRQRTRDLTVQQRRDGSARLSGELTPECAERLLVHFDALAAPAPETDGVKDLRTAGQRRHDALLATLELQQRAELLPTVSGVSSTVIITLDTDAYLTGQGLATTGHGALVPAADALTWGGGDTRVFTVALNTMNAVSHYGTAHRLFTENQRLAMIARDRGCTFPNCPKPAAWTQANHTTPFHQHGPTSTDNGALLCGYHHRSFEQLGWRPLMVDGRPAWIPPPWIDPEQQPRHNQLHHIDLPDNDPGGGGTRARSVTAA